jgi:hypothetical protein
MGDFKKAEIDFKKVQSEVEKTSKIHTEKAAKTPRDETIEVEPIKSEKAPEAEQKKTANIAKSKEKNKETEQKVPDLGKMGSGIIDNFYEGIYESLKEGKETFSGVKDNLLVAAKPAFDAGQIKSIDDLKNFAKFYIESLSKEKKK